MMRLEAENWKIALGQYEGHPIAALTLAYQLIGLRQCLQRGKRGIPDALAGLDLAIESLYAHTDFDMMGRKFYHRAIEDKLKPDQAEKLRELGVKI
jgi:hypothetical protein